MLFRIPAGGQKDFSVALFRSWHLSLSGWWGGFFNTHGNWSFLSPDPFSPPATSMSALNLISIRLFAS